MSHGMNRRRDPPEEKPSSILQLWPPQFGRSEEPFEELPFWFQNPLWSPTPLAMTRSDRKQMGSRAARAAEVFRQPPTLRRILSPRSHGQTALSLAQHYEEH